jgi:hypothetical protein
MTIMLLNGVPNSLATVGVTQTITVTLSDAPANVINAVYRVKGTCDDVQSGEADTIVNAMMFNINRSTWGTTFATPYRALPLGGRAVLIELTLYLSDGTTETVTGIVYSIVDAACTGRPLASGQSMETDARTGWITQANAPLRTTERGLGTPIASIPTASDPYTVQTSEPVGTSRIWFDPTEQKLYWTENGTNRRFWIVGTEEVIA